MSQHHLRILVVDDDRDAADALGRLLKRHGHDVMVAYTGPVGLYAAKAWLPEAVICDIRLPGLDGYGVVRELRRDPATARARMIAITGYGDEEYRRQSSAAGFDAHLTKPADPDVLRELLAPTQPVHPRVAGLSPT
jgi:CheY-like chemotaxis protein